MANEISWREAATDSHAPSRPLGANSDPYENIRKAIAGPPIPQDYANTFSEAMVAAITNVRQNFGQMFTDIETGQVKTLDGFRSMAKGILSSMLQVVNNSVAQSFLNTIGKLIPSFGGSTSEGFDFGDIPGHALGGSIKRYAGGGANRDSVLARLTPGEFVMRTSAVEAIGRENLERLNSMGNARKSLSGIPAPEKKSEPVPVNVWVVAKERIPQMGKNDVLAIVTDDMLTGGATKKLVRSIAAGH